MTTYNLDIANDKDDLTLRASELLVKTINSSLNKKDRIQIALSGGSTPSSVYKILSKIEIPWNRVDVFLGDERWVDSSNDSSNSLMIKNTLLSNPPGSKACFHLVPTTDLSSPEESAEYFERILNQKCIGSPPIFDLILLGLGEDGHTASLFPYSESLDVTDKWATVGRGKGQDRITLTFPVFCAAKKIVFLVSGSSKQNALQRLLDPSEPSRRTPAKLVKPSSQIIVLADKNASVLL
tara:strand:- start:6645 stop:7358 length:714 start_codon:yes stop_codon:yes gene_type:complete